MRQTTACYLVRYTPEMEVLLGYKKVGFGAGKYAGIGGKLEAGETIEQATIREVAEEVGVSILVDNLQYMGTVTFIFPFRPEWSQEVSLFLVDTWQGEPQESDEMRPGWYKLADIPYHAMWQDARIWLPPVLQGTQIQVQISFKPDHETVDEVRWNPALIRNS